MNKQELIEEIGNLDKLYGEKFYIALDDVLDLVKQLDEPEAGHADEAPRYVKNILARLRELPLHDREVWLKAIMGEFEQDFSHAKWREGYEQGKFESSWVGNQLKDADKIRQELNRPVIPQLIADWIKVAKPVYSLSGAMVYGSPGVNKWLENFDNQDLFALAWILGYEVEKRKYVVTDGNHLYFKGYQEDVDIVILADEQPGTMDYVKKFDSKEEAQKAADILGWKVQEVE